MRFGFKAQHTVGHAGDDVCGNGLLAAHGIDGDATALNVQELGGKRQYRVTAEAGDRGSADPADCRLAQARMLSRKSCAMALFRLI